MNEVSKRVLFYLMIGVNEIGIPVHFAKTLHYPTPVNDWNVKYLRKLVENGPTEYPGMI